MEGDTAVVTGYIRSTSNPSSEKIKAPIHEEKEEFMSSHDVYKELRLRGYNYSGLFQSVKSSTIDGCNGHIAWHNNWVTFMDNMLQMLILGIDSRQLLVPNSIKKLVIDWSDHVNLIKKSETNRK